ncbi:MAG TPA: DUF1214 domain-containing protein [Bacteroidales bacterium]|nr:DUF1214 domain-containing protein [Bacteroidales bacterium]
MEEEEKYKVSSDARSKPLTGGKNYRLHLPPNIPARNFWSVIVYDNRTHLMIHAGQPWPSIHGHSGKLTYNQDGSLDIYFGPKAPDGRENNWIQTIPGKEWNMILRLYGPLESWYDKTWRPGQIEEWEAITE